MSQPSNVNRAKINCNKETVCKEWLKITRQLHGLTDSEIALAAKFLEKRIELKSKISDDDMVDEYIQSTKVKTGIRDAANISSMAVFQNMMTSLRKKGFFTEDNKISKAFIPNISNESKFFKVEFILMINDK